MKEILLAELKVTDIIWWQRTHKNKINFKIYIINYFNTDNCSTPVLPTNKILYCNLNFLKTYGSTLWSTSQDRYTLCLYFTEWYSLRTGDKIVGWRTRTLAPTNNFVEPNYVMYYVFLTWECSAITAEITLHTNNDPYKKNVHGQWPNIRIQKDSYMYLFYDMLIITEC